MLRREFLALAACIFTIVLLFAIKDEPNVHPGTYNVQIVSPHAKT